MGGEESGLSIRLLNCRDGIDPVSLTFMETEIKIEISQEQFVRFREQTDFLKVSKEDIYYSKFNTEAERIKNNEPLVRIRKSNSDYYFTTKSFGGFGYTKHMPSVRDIK